MAVGPTSKPGFKYTVTHGETAYRVAVGPDGAVTLNDLAREVHLESIDGTSLFSLLVADKSYEVFVEAAEGEYSVTVEGERYRIQVADEPGARRGGPAARGRPETRTPTGGNSVAGGTAGGAAISPMTGVLVELLVAEGQPVKAGDGVAILEAMKTRNVIRASRDGVVRKVQVTVGQTIRMDHVILYVDSPAG